MTLLELEGTALVSVVTEHFTTLLETLVTLSRFTFLLRQVRFTLRDERFSFAFSVLMLIFRVMVAALCFSCLFPPRVVDLLLLVSLSRAFPFWSGGCWTSSLLSSGTFV